MAHVEQLIAATKASQLEPQEIESLVGHLRGLRNQSISQSGRILAGYLGSRSYMDKAPSEFFTHCYRLRSSLVHGEVPRPSREEVGRAAASMQQFVGDLISRELLSDQGK